MVPTPPQTSRFEEPSSGSNSTQYLRSAPSSAAQDHRLFVLLRGHDRDAFAPAERAQQDVVGDHVELLLLFALHVLVADRAEHVLEARAAHLRGDHLRGDRQRRQDPGQLAAGFGIARLLLQDVRLQGDDVGGAGGAAAVLSIMADMRQLDSRR